MKKLIFLVFLGIILLAGFVAAGPPNPMAFYGEVIYSGGIPDGYYITAKIDNVIHGQCLIINNQYGYGDNACIVVSDQSALINFYIGNTVIGNHPFESKEIVELNFTLTTLPPKPQPLSNGICEPDLGECSFNFVDCHVSLTTVCTGNLRCDVEIGETCSTCPTDCGVCPTTTTTTSGGGSPGGDSSLGSTSGDVNTDNTNSNSNETQNNVGGGMTGATIGSSGGTGFLPLLILLVVFIAGIVLIFILKKPKKESGNIKRN